VSGGQGSFPSRKKRAAPGFTRAIPQRRGDYELPATVNNLLRTNS
jgi:hypothetical protein